MKRTIKGGVGDHTRNQVHPGLDVSIRQTPK